MNKRVIIAGAGGRFGRSAAAAFKTAGWEVTALVRSKRPEAPRHADRLVLCDAMDRQALAAACEGHDVIVNALNPPYEDWAQMLSTLTRNVIAAAKESGATVCIPGNVYVYGNPVPEVLTETTPHSESTKKGRLRIEMERAYRQAANEGVRTIILRSGDYMEGRDTGNWFETHIARSVGKGILSYPGPSNIAHAWAYLPDKARAMVMLAEKRESFALFEEFGFEGFAISGDQLANLATQAVGKEVRVAAFPWIAVKAMAPFSRRMREVLEMRYLWQQPHQIEGSKLRQALPQFEPENAESAIALALPGMPAPRPVSGRRNRHKAETTVPAQPDPVQ